MSLLWEGNKGDVVNKDFDIEVTGMGFNITGYPGAFTPTVKRIIENTI